MIVFLNEWNPRRALVFGDQRPGTLYHLVEVEKQIDREHGRKDNVTQYAQHHPDTTADAHDSAPDALHDCRLLLIDNLLHALRTERIERACKCLTAQQRNLTGKHARP